MDPIDIIKLHSLMDISAGNPRIIIGIIDGPVDLKHPAFNESNIVTVNNAYPVNCSIIDSNACKHGTFIAGVLAAKRGIPAPSICPSCGFALRPIFQEHSTSLTKATIDDLSFAIEQTINAGAKIINLSLGIPFYQGIIHPLEEAYAYARERDVIIIISAGNQGRIGMLSIANNEWVIPVAACNENGLPLIQSNLGIDIGKNGVMAPGINIRSTFPDGKYNHMGGTSVAAAFVSGAIALLWSMYPKAKASEIIYAVRKSSRSNSIIPAVLNAEAAWTILKSI